MQFHLVVQTASGQVQGFADTFPLRDSSSASVIAKGASGGEKAVWKWLVSFRGHWVSDAEALRGRAMLTF